jgi:predicted regulator of Ras-like GTPase activity (Roadblock/LC7/MglB family)
MSCFSCTKPGDKAVPIASSLPPDVCDLLERKLRQLQTAVPDIKYPCIVTKGGLVFASVDSSSSSSNNSNNNVVNEDFACGVSALQQAAAKFSSVLTAGGGCPHLEIAGQAHEFNLYVLDPKKVFIFAYYCTPQRSSPYGFKDPTSSSLHAVTIEKLVEELKVILSQIADLT